jgi:hypothetical protein
VEAEVAGVLKLTEPGVQAGILLKKPTGVSGPSAGVSAPESLEGRSSAGAHGLALLPVLLEGVMLLQEGLLLVLVLVVLCVLYLLRNRRE